MRHLRVKSLRLTTTTDYSTDSDSVTASLLFTPSGIGMPTVHIQTVTQTTQVICLWAQLRASVPSMHGVHELRL